MINEDTTKILREALHQFELAKIRIDQLERSNVVLQKLVGRLVAERDFVREERDRALAELDEWKAA